ncbi:MAG TPA: PaeR7I family type II restriction endonuclease [Thermoplasmata archaeon]|nr:PaeR7I family type II restriction endonuclease [Thermoplasmata archaeon]
MRSYWTNRAAAGKKSKKKVGTRGEAVAGNAMDGFAKLIVRTLLGAGVPEEWIRVGRRATIPGYYRPEKQWDILVISDGALRLAIELKSQVGSFGNNANNRLEEGIGNAVDAQKTLQLRNLGRGGRTWLGFAVLLEDQAKYRKSVKISEHNFPVDSGLRELSYAGRYMEWCRRVRADGLYSGTAFIRSPRGVKGDYDEPGLDLTFSRFLSEIRGLWGPPKPPAHMQTILDTLPSGSIDPPSKVGS